jgi:hypothetical protein
LKTPAISICYGVSPGFYKAKFATDFDCIGLSEWPQAFYKPLGLEELPVVMRVRLALALALWATFQSAASPVAVNAGTPSPVWTLGELLTCSLNSFSTPAVLSSRSLGLASSSRGEIPHPVLQQPVAQALALLPPAALPLRSAHNVSSGLRSASRDVRQRRSSHVFAMLVFARCSAENVLPCCALLSFARVSGDGVRPRLAAMNWARCSGDA